jgi:hypothetical protein
LIIFKIAREKNMDAIQRQQQDIQENAHAISCLVKFCTDVNIGTLPESMYLLKSIVCNMQYIQKDVLYALLFGKESYVNWELSENMLKRFMLKRRTNSIGGASSWFYLLRYVRADSEIFQQQSTNSMRNMYRPFYIVLDACKQEFAGTSIPVDLSEVARIFLMILLIGIQPVHAISIILTPVVQKHLHQTSASYAQNIALKILEEKFTPSQYIDTMQWLITKKIIVEDNSNLQTEVDFHLEKQLRNTGIMKMQVGTLNRLWVHTYMLCKEYILCCFSV